MPDGWASIHTTFQSVPLDCFPEQSENLYNKAEYILPAQVHKLYSHSPLQSNSAWVENMDLHIYFALTTVKLLTSTSTFNIESMPNYLYFFGLSLNK